jgi:hypothetical protein
LAKEFKDIFYDGENKSWSIYKHQTEAIIKGNEVIGVLDVDSTHLDFFDEDDLTGLEEIANILANEVF